MVRLNALQWDGHEDDIVIRVGEQEIRVGEQVRKNVAAGVVKVSRALVDPGVAVVLDKQWVVYLDLGDWVDRVERGDTDP